MANPAGKRRMTFFFVCAMLGACSTRSNTPGGAGGGSPPEHYSGGSQACTGIPHICDALGNITDCNAVDGCTWSNFTSHCSGTAFPCVDFTDKPNCCVQGCSWNKESCPEPGTSSPPDGG
jgi:hypothetical protein